MAEREWVGRRLPLWLLLIIGIVLVAAGVLLVVLINNRAFFAFGGPVAIFGFYVLAYTAGELRRRRG